MSVAHTPGPWTQNNYEDIVGPDGEQIRVMGVVLSSGPVASANKRLIAAAPDLLEALILMVRTHDEPATSSLQMAKEQQWLEQARAAVAKATGSAS